MRGRARFGALGLRGRIIGVVLVTVAAALAVAAATLLSQLESSLKNADQRALNHELQGASKSHQLPAAAKPFEKLRPDEVIYTALSPRRGKPPPGTAGLIARGTHARDHLADAASRLQFRVGASYVVVVGYPDANGNHPHPVVVWPPSANASQKSIAHIDPYFDAARAFQTHRARYTPGTVGGTEYARAAIPFTADGQLWVLAVRKPLNDVSSAVAAVRTAILDAALVAAALTVLLAIPLAVTIVRRLRLLRHAALRVAQEGPNVEIPVDRALDEVGDLARTFALMQQQLRRQEEARRAFVATASHELRTPVASLDGLLELLDEDLQSGQADLEDARSLIARARGQSRRLGRLAADLLDLSRIDARTDLRSEPVELGELSRAVLAEFDLGTTRRGVVTMLDDSAGSVWALGDPGSVARILRILLDNAVRLSPPGGEIRVELRNGERASLSVCDRGPGVPPEERDMIFERFMRGRAAGGKAGFGLGLAIGRELAGRMGGELVLEDQPGPGARFTLRLPVAHAPQEEPVALA